MKSKYFLAPAALLVLTLLLLVGVRAMSSANYSLNWYVPLSGAGGGRSTSPSYQADFTIGQSAAGSAAGTSYKVGLGYWHGVGQYYTYLPVILK